MPDPDIGLELALSALTATGIALLVAARWRDRLGPEAKSLRAKGEQLERELAERSDYAGRWNEHYRTPEEQALTYARNSPGSCSSARSPILNVDALPSPRQDSMR